MPIKITNTLGELEFKRFVFPAGEVGIKLKHDNYRWLQGANEIITARIQSSQDFMELTMIKDALERLGKKDIKLFLPYFPYSRQDRVCVKGESFSLKVFANLVNSLNFSEVITLDTHSNVTDAVVDRVKVFSQFDVINKWPDLISRLMGTVLISPDAGSNKKTAEIAGFLNHSEFVRADKLRDLSNGKIKETIVYCDDFKGRDVACLDDILDGGRTFIELAKVCKAKNCGKFILFITHCIASKGFDTLFNEGIDEIWTTDGFKDINDERVKVLNVEKFLN